MYPKKRHQNIPASYLILRRDNHILLLRRLNTGYEDGNYGLVAGHVDPGESFTECIIREAKEEAGIIIRPEHLQVAHVMHRNSGLSENNERVDVFFTASEWQGETHNTESHKCDDFNWFPLDRLPDNLVPYIRQVLKDIQNKIFYSEWGWNSSKY